MAKLELIVDSYSSPSSRDADAVLIPRTRGERFEPLDAQERDRLLEIGAAVDPEEAQKQREEALQAERDQIEARRAALDAELDALVDPSKLKSDDVNAQLNQRNLSTEGNLDERRARLSEALAAER
jgi:hypothetical protein